MKRLSVSYPTKRVARPLRVEFDGAWYHVMNRGAGRRPIFTSPTRRTLFYKFLDQITRIYAVEIHAYCLMENHYHLLLSTPEAGLGRAMRHLNGLYAQHINRASGTDGPLFRGRYRSILVDADTYLLQLNRYIHLNPVNAGLVRFPEAYRHSSYRAYIGMARRRRWLHTAHCLGLFGGKDAQDQYRRFVEDGLDEVTHDFYSKPRLAPIFGRPKFQEEVRRRAEVEKKRTDLEIPDARRIRRIDLESVARAVCLAFRIEEPALRRLNSRGTIGNGPARGTFAYLARFEGGHSLSAIAAWLGYRHYTGPSVAIARLRIQLETKPGIAHRFQAARQFLYEVKT